MSAKKRDLLAKRLKKKTAEVNEELLEAAYKLATGFRVEESEEGKYVTPNSTVNLFLIKSRMPEFGQEAEKDGTIEVVMEGETKKFSE